MTYKAWTSAGDPFDSSDDQSGAKTFLVSSVMPGLAEALQIMTIGQKMRVWIPERLLSQDIRDGGIRELIYDLELVGYTRLEPRRTVPLELTSPGKTT